MKKVCAIVPAYNEAATVAGVVGVLVVSELIHEVIVVSDGSTDATAELARQAGATVYERPHKGGKGNAMLEGLRKTSAEVILFCDADLMGFSGQHLPLLLEPVLSGERIMQVGRRDRGFFLNFLTPFLPLLSGERAVRRQVVEAIPSQFLRGFMIESALNYYCRSRRLPYGGVLLPGLSIRHKYQKVGWLLGIWQYWRMSWQVIKAMVLVRVHMHNYAKDR